MRNNTCNIVAIAIFVICSTTIDYSLGDEPEALFPQITDEEKFEVISERITWMNDIIQKGISFHELKKHTFPGFLKVPFYENSVTLFYKRTEKNQLRLVGAEIGKVFPSFSVGKNLSAHLSLHENRTIGFYCEFMQGHNLEIFFDEQGKLNRITLTSLSGERKISFDKKEQVLTETFTKHKEEELNEYQKHRKQWESEIQDYKNKITKIKPEISPKEWKIKIPDKLHDKTIRNRFLQIEKCHQSIIEGKVLPLLDNKVFFKPDINYSRIQYVNIIYSGNSVTFVGVHEHENFRTIGSFLVFDDDYCLKKYVEGEIEYNQNLIGHEVAKTAKLFLENGKASGLEITFHSNGYPSNYRTIVKERLYGRQIEWNDKGEVISDVDLDIPKPWLDAPKNVENPQSKN
ncbi:MAG: hypothetical protein LBG80_10590 [Bacteroidales bacterium]|nr:hypothetical protein [Bacteroidales bacterium]